MRAVVQRVSQARVTVDDSVVGAIGPGLCVFLGVAQDDSTETAISLAGKLARLRIFPNETGRLDRSVLDTGGAAIVVSQFTLIAETARGNRPDFANAAPPLLAKELYARFVEELRVHGIIVETGQFGASMLVEMTNDGPVTLILER